MNYAKSLILKVRDSSQWPSFDRDDFLEELEELAFEAFSKKSTEGYLAALLIYHQLCEEMVRLCIRDSQFYVQLAVFPAEIRFPNNEKKMFGQLLEELRNSISFSEKEQFFSKCSELNGLRIEVVHKLTRQEAIFFLEMKLLDVSQLFDEISELFSSIHDFFRACFKDFKKDTFIDYNLGEFDE